MSRQVAVVGAGIIGLSVAWRLAQGGADVVVIEREAQVGQGASRAAAGMLAPTAEVGFEEQALLRLNQASRQMWPGFAQELEAAAGFGVDYRREGTMVVALDRDDGEALGRLHRYQQGLGLPAEMLSGDAALEREPALAPSVARALWCPQDHQVDPRLVIDALAAALEGLGVEVRTGAQVESMVVARGRIEAVELADGERVEAQQVVWAAGAWSRKVGGVERRQLPRVRPIRGQMIACAMEPGPICRHVIRAPDAYLVPKSDGRLLIGATMEEMGFDPRVTAGGLFELLRGAWEAMPGVYDLPVIDTWSGFRPMSWENEPYVGASQDVQGLWFATGHGRNGVLLAPWTAQRLVTQMERGLG